MQLPVLAAAHGVAGMEPAVAPGFLGGGRVLEVAGEEAAPRVSALLTNEQFSSFFLNLNIKTCRRASDTTRADVARLAASRDHGAAARLGHRPRLDQREAEARLESARGLSGGVRALPRAHDVRGGQRRRVHP